MATDVDVQYFSHLNGLTLGNNWGDLIRLLDKVLVTGVDFTQITAASIDAQGDVHITLYAAHNAMLFQVVELAGFAPTSLNQKYRIKGVPSTTELILKPHTVITETSITTVGSGKLASLGYEIVFRDLGDVKRVYRAKNPTAQHPFIRVDESISDGVNSYNSDYAKYAMVGLLEHMEHIDDYKNPDVLQLPFDPSDPAKNWRITGTGAGVVRGWNRWYYYSNRMMSGYTSTDAGSLPVGVRGFNIVGDADAFYFSVASSNNIRDRCLYGCGLYKSSVDNSIIPNWFLAGSLTGVTAGADWTFVDYKGSTPFVSGWGSNTQVFFTPKYNLLERISVHADAKGITPDNLSGKSQLYSDAFSAIEVPLFTEKRLVGVVIHACYAGNLITMQESVVVDRSMYLSVPVGLRSIDNEYGGYHFYLGELE